MSAVAHKSVGAWSRVFGVALAVVDWLVAGVEAAPLQAVDQELGNLPLLAGGAGDPGQRQVEIPETRGVDRRPGALQPPPPFG